MKENEKESEPLVGAGRRRLNIGFPLPQNRRIFHMPTYSRIHATPFAGKESLESKMKLRVKGRQKWLHRTGHPVSLPSIHETEPVGRHTYT